MKNKNLLKQNLFSLAAIILSWILFFSPSAWSSDYLYSDYILLWLIFIWYTFWFLPFAYLQHKRLAKNKKTPGLNKAFRTINYIFIGLVLAPLVLDAVLESYSYLSSLFNFSYFPFGLPRGIDFWFYLINPSGILKFLSYTSPFFVTAVLLYLANQANKHFEAEGL